MRTGSDGDHEKGSFDLEKMACAFREEKGEVVLMVPQAVPVEAHGLPSGVRAQWVSKTVEMLSLARTTAGANDGRFTEHR